MADIGGKGVMRDDVEVTEVAEGGGGGGDGDGDGDGGGGEGGGGGLDGAWNPVISATKRAVHLAGARWHVSASSSGWRVIRSS